MLFCVPGATSSLGLPGYHSSGLGPVLVLTVAAPRSDEHPPVLLQQLWDFSDLHGARIAGDPKVPADGSRLFSVVAVQNGCSLTLDAGVERCAAFRASAWALMVWRSRRRRSTAGA